MYKVNGELCVRDIAHLPSREVVIRIYSNFEKWDCLVIFVYNFFLKIRARAGGERCFPGSRQKRRPSQSGRGRGRQWWGQRREERRGRWSYDGRGWKDPFSSCRWVRWIDSSLPTFTVVNLVRVLFPKFTVLLTNWCRTLHLCGVFMIFVLPERMFMETHTNPNSVCPWEHLAVRPSVKVSVNIFQLAPAGTVHLQLQPNLGHRCTMGTFMLWYC